MNPNQIKTITMESYLDFSGKSIIKEVGDFLIEKMKKMMPPVFNA